MRILPRSARGTWLLAAAAWAAICVFAWAIAPVMPRAILHLPADSELLGLGPNAENALVLRNTWCPKGEEFDHQKLELFDVSSGRSAASLSDRCGGIRLVGQSGDGRTWLLREADITNPRLLRLDLPTHSLHPLSVRVPDSLVTRYALSGDGRLCVLDDKSAKSIILWDIVEDRQRAELNGLKPPFAIGADSRSLAALTTDELHPEISVIDLTTLATRCTLPVPPDPPFADIWRVGLNADGSYLVAVVAGFWGLSAPTHCWNVATKTKCFGDGTTLQGDNGVLIGHNKLIADAFDDQHEKHLRWFDLDTGATKADVPMDRNAPWSLSPSGRTAEIWVGVERNEFFGRMADRVGIRWPFSVSGKTGPAFFDAATGHHMGTVPAYWDRSFMVENPTWLGPPTCWASDCQAIAIGHDHRVDKNGRWGPWGEWQLWDIPPRKPLAWFALAAAVLALPLAWLARRRVRRQRSLAGITP